MSNHCHGHCHQLCHHSGSGVFSGQSLCHEHRTLLEQDLRGRRKKSISQLASEIVLSLQNIYCVKPEMQLFHPYFTTRLLMPMHNLSSPLCTHLLIRACTFNGLILKRWFSSPAMELIVSFSVKLSTSLQRMQSLRNLYILTSS